MPIRGTIKFSCMKLTNLKLLMTDKAKFFYEVMPFDLKKTGATYQRLMD